MKGYQTELAEPIPSQQLQLPNQGYQAELAEPKQNTVAPRNHSSERSAASGSDTRIETVVELVVYNDFYKG